MRSASRLDHRMDLVHNHSLDGPEHLPASLRREQEVERLGCSDQDVGRLPDHCRPLAGRRVPRSNCGRYPWRGEPQLFGQPPDLSPGLGQVEVNIRAQRLKRGHVHHPGFVGEGRLESFTEELVE
jgi:hypothetical protein